MKILYNFASRSRPEKLIRCIENIIQNSTHNNYVILLTLDVDDTTVANKGFYEKLVSYGANIKPVYGFSKNKIEAINRSVWIVSDWDICISTADDMVFTDKGFDSKIIELFNKYFPDTDGFLHLPDGKVNERLPTLCIIGKKLYDYFGYIYNPIYSNVYCDNEQFDVVRILNKYHYEPVHLFKHLHPIWGLSEMDDLYNRNENKENYAIDGEIYRKRKSINFGL